MDAQNSEILETPAEVIFKRDDEHLLESFTTILLDGHCVFALSKCIENLMEQDETLVSIRLLQALLGKEQNLLFRGLAADTNRKLLSALKNKDLEFSFDYEKSIKVLQNLLAQIVVEKKRCYTIAKDELLLPLVEQDENTLRKFLNEISGKEGAALISLLPAKAIQNLTDNLSEKSKKEIYGGFSHSQDFTASFIQSVLRKYKKFLNTSQGQRPIGGEPFIVELLESMPDNDSKEFLQALESNPELHHSISRQFITVSAIYQMDQRSLRIFISEFEPGTIAHFILITGEKMEETLFPLLSERNLAIVKDTITTLRNSTKNRRATRIRAEECKKQMLEKLRDLVDKKEIILKDN